MPTEEEKDNSHPNREIHQLHHHEIVDEIKLNKDKVMTNER